MDKKTASRWADQYAEEAFKNHASSRRGVWHIELLDCLLIYNNNPFKVSTIRPKEMKRITSQLNAIGISTLARGKGGEVMDSCGDHYTASLLLDCGVDRRPEVVAIVEDAAAWATDELDNYLQELRK